MKRLWILLPAIALLAGCAAGGGSVQSVSSSAPPADPGTAGGRYAMSSDAYPETPPDVANVPDAVPRPEPRASGGNRSTYEVWGKTYHVLDDPRGYRQEGTASWYGKKFHGYATASGDIYDMYEMSAAHRSLPLPSYVRVTNLDNGRQVIVRVNDRGPFHGSREIDLSYAAAARLDILDRGTGRVRVEAIDPVAWQARHSGGTTEASDDTSGTTATARRNAPVQPASPDRDAAENVDTDGSLFLQVAALGSQGNAQALKTRLEGELDQPVRVTSDARLHRVQVGPLAATGDLEPVREALRRAGFDQALVIHDGT
ncbi:MULTISPECIES: septal ring lytic transglycosylase RlpA family protein [Halomonadaceae]|jgi:rare lipoprotein A|uniref:septal ring lytic transglycosylase RlpA family protein n=1 Tax=Halomonadaceae TaxID=28256 RepID=UPI0015840A5D|nr:MULTISPECIES: septal ring lytic transglycosylase RlpA family protein [Halomonas]MDI4636160.1 septal ring lytic transglycosylase RlpA family protein [Halomonas sp. BMC7]NUJ60526.1 septal ring lytic transglycosylase RlpA family protein [Halomonas taeanensis]